MRRWVLTAGQATAHRVKVEQLLTLVEGEMGGPDPALRPRAGWLYMLVRGGRIVGAAVAENTRQARRMVPREAEPPSEPADASGAGAGPERCGIRLVWVHRAHRRQGLATAMLNTVLSTHAPGKRLEPGSCAFSDPTPDGQRLAAAWCGRPDFLIYTPAAFAAL